MFQGEKWDNPRSQSAERLSSTNHLSSGKSPTAAFRLLYLHKVTAVEPCLVRRVDDNGEIAEVGGAVRVCRKEQVGVFSFESFMNRAVDRGVLSTEVANLAGFRVGIVAGRLLATAVRVEVCTSGVTVAIFGDGILVDVIG